MFYVPAEVVQKSVPDGLQIQKYHFIPDIEALLEKAVEARSLGPAAAEGWFQGLSTEGQSAQNEAARFEHWETSGALSAARSAMLTSASAQPREGNQNNFVTPTSIGEIPRPTLSSQPNNLLHPLPPPPLGLPLMPLPHYGLPPGLDSTWTMQMNSDTASMDSQKSTRTQRAAPSSREIARMKSNKKHDIVRRCRRLNPPISPDMLERLDAFEAALQIQMPLNESAWETLKERLLEQRHKVMLQDEAKNNVTRAPIPGQFRPPSRTDDYVLAHADVPIKEKLCEIAEEYIKQKWGYGGYVTYPSSPHFAADVLIYTKRAYLDQKARIESLQAQAGYLRVASEEDDTLTLDHMKWVFEQTIKPRTEQIRKDLFLCSVCTTQGNIKYFAFDSIIQHYASKHTSDFSRGTALYWKAKWPDQPPFDPHPERIRTPEPSITHTPTLSNKPLSVISPGSIMTATAQSAGWRSPDTMSLVSNTTNTLSAIVPLTRYPVAPSATGPPYLMYHTQRDVLASEVLQGWNMASKASGAPKSLQLHLALNYGFSNFSRKYSNEPALGLFSDCLKKQDLRELRDIDNLRCWECVIHGDLNARASWALHYLIAHFEKSHVERNPAAAKLKWHTDMVALPEPALIKSLLTVGDIPAPLQTFLEDAHLAAIYKAAETVRLDAPAQQQVNNGQRTEGNLQALRSPVYAAELPRVTNGYNAYQQRYATRADPSTAATWGEVNSSRDMWSASSRTMRGDELSESDSTSRRYGVPDRDRYPLELGLSPYRPTSLSASGVALEDRHENIIHAAAEPMTRSNTIRPARPQRSNEKPHVTSAADDFLSTIESSLDVEMAESGLDSARSAIGSKPVSRSNSAAGSAVRVSRRATPDYVSRREATANARALYEHTQQAARTILQAEPAPGYHPRSPTTLASRDNIPQQTMPMERGPSRVIEFDEQGTPIPQEGRVYHELSPPQHNFTRRLVDRYGRLEEPVPPNYYRGHPVELREVPIERVHYPADGGYPRYAYEPVERVPAHPYHRDRLYDQTTGQYYVAEHPTTGQYVEIINPSGRPSTHYEERSRMVQYREIDPANHGNEHRARPHEQRHGGYPSNNYQGR